MKQNKGISQITVMVIMLVLAIALPITTRLVQKSQENRSKAMVEIEDGGGSCSDLLYDECRATAGCHWTGTAAYNGYCAVGSAPADDTTGTGTGIGAEACVAKGGACQTNNGTMPGLGSSCNVNGKSGTYQANLCVGNYNGGYRCCVPVGTGVCSATNCGNCNYTDCQNNTSCHWTGIASYTGTCVSALATPSCGCGSANDDVPVSVKPVINLCQSGQTTTGAVDKGSYWEWTCTGGGCSTATCNVLKRITTTNNVGSAYSPNSPSCMTKGGFCGSFTTTLNDGAVCSVTGKIDNGFIISGLCGGPTTVKCCAPLNKACTDKNGLCGNWVVSTAGSSCNNGTGKIEIGLCMSQPTNSNYRCCVPSPITTSTPIPTAIPTSAGCGSSDLNCPNYQICSNNTCVPSREDYPCIRDTQCLSTMKCVGGRCATPVTPAPIPACTDANWTSTLSPTTCPSNGQQTKTWTKTGTCSGGVTYSTQTVNCTYNAPACVYSYSEWGVCTSSNVQMRTFTSTPSGCQGSPDISKACTYVVPPVCTANTEKRCSVGGDLEICNANGSGWNTTDCGAFSCNDTTKTCDICINNTQKCSANNYFSCNNGTWSNTTTNCSSGQICTSGAISSSVCRTPDYVAPNLTMQIAMLGISNANAQCLGSINLKVNVSKAGQPGITREVTATKVDNKFSTVTVAGDGYQVFEVKDFVLDNSYALIDKIYVNVTSSSNSKLKLLTTLYGKNNQTSGFAGQDISLITVSSLINNTLAFYNYPILNGDIGSISSINQGDGVMNGIDFVHIKNEWGKTVSAGETLRSDLNGDCIVNSLDFQIYKNSVAEQFSSKSI